jgi:Flp pilus assembly protein TadB
MNVLKPLFGLTLLCFLLFSTESAAAISTTSSVETNRSTAFENVKKGFSELKKEGVKSFRKAAKKITTALGTTAGISSLLLLVLVGLASIGLGIILSIGFLTYLGGVLILVAAVWFVLQLVGLI